MEKFIKAANQPIRPDRMDCELPREIQLPAQHRKITLAMQIWRGIPWRACARRRFADIPDQQIQKAVALSRKRCNFADR